MVPVTVCPRRGKATNNTRATVSRTDERDMEPPLRDVKKMLRGCEGYVRKRLASIATFEEIDLHVHFARVVAKLRLLRFLDPGGPDERLFDVINLRVPNRIRLMMYASAIKMMTLVDGVEDVSLDEKKFDRSEGGFRVRNIGGTVMKMRGGRHHAARVVAFRDEVDARDRAIGRAA